MPNYVDNRVTITGTKKSLISIWGKLMEGVNNKKGFLHTFKPMPDILRTFHTGGARDWRTGESLGVWREIEQGTYPDGRIKHVAEKIPDEEMANIVAEHGTASWYDWANKNWGVKWDRTLTTNIDEDGVFIKMNTRSISIDWTAPWSYPEPIYQLIADEYGVNVSVRLSGEWDGNSRVSFTPNGSDYI